MIKQAFRLFYRTKYLFISFIVLMGYITIKILSVFSKWIFVVDYPSRDSLLFRSNEMSFFYFSVFIILAFEMSNILKRNNVSESLCVSSKREGVVSNIKMLILLNSVLAIFYLLINISGFLIRFEIKWEYIWNIVLNIVVNYWLCAITGILLGSIITYIKNSKISYIVITCMVLLLSPIMSIFGEITYNNEPFYQIKKWFSILPQGLNFVENHYIGFAVQIQRISLILLWIAMCLLGLCYILKESIKRKSIIIGLILFSVCGCILPGHELTPSFQTSNWILYPQYYYSNQTGTWEQECEYFYVKEYQIDFLILNQLYATVTMKIDKSDLEQYGFTLYHGYSVNSVCDQDGVELKFEQKNDYLTVFADSEEINQLTITYSGTGTPFYSELSGTYLKSGIAFFPVAGYHTQYDNNKFTDVIAEKTYFDVDVNSINNYYCTLDENENNHFSGQASSFTLIDGIVSVDNVNDVTFVYPTLTAFNRNVSEVEEAFISQMDLSMKENEIDYSIHGKTVIMDVKTNAEPIASFFDDHLIVYGLQFSGFVEDKYLEYFKSEGGEESND